MKTYRGIFSLLGALAVAALACNTPAVAPTPSADMAATQASIALTQTALSPDQNPAVAQPESTATTTLTPEAPAAPSDPMASSTPSLTPSITPTSTPSIPIVSVSENTNCRTGPGVNYDLETSLLEGEQAEVVGKYTSTTPIYWIIQKGNDTCWLWGEYATVEGNTSDLPEMVPPPSPTPEPTATDTDTPTPEPSGDLYIVQIFMTSGFEIVVGVGTDPIDSLSGSFQYTLYADGAQAAQGSCTIPADTDACNTGHIVSGEQSIQVVIDSNNAIHETDEDNNTITATCNKYDLICE